MRIDFSPHAEKRLKERGVDKEKIIEVINFPDYTIRRSNYKIEAFKKIKDKILKVVYFQIENYIKVITSYYLD